MFNTYIYIFFFPLTQSCATKIDEGTQTTNILLLALLGDQWMILILHFIIFELTTYFQSKEMRGRTNGYHQREKITRAASP